MQKVFFIITIATFLSQLTSCATYAQSKLQKIETQIHELQRNFASTNFDIDSLDSRLKSLNLAALNNKEGLSKLADKEKESD
jgi:peptidoglycan hydrolase CwlO-like protein